MSLSRRLNVEVTPVVVPVAEWAKKGHSREKQEESRLKSDRVQELKERVLRQVVEEMGGEMDLRRGVQGDREQFGEKATQVLKWILDEETTFLSRVERERIVNEVTDEITGYGPIDVLLRDPEISEVMVNGPGQIFVERKGKLERSEITFRDDEHVMHTIQKIIIPLGRRLDEASPLVDARLPDGSRVNAIIPPLAVHGPTLTIRKFAKDPLTVENLIQFGTLSTEMALFLKACVQSRLNIVVSGSTGSGKTTLLNILSSFIPEDERIVTIEDAAELQLRQEHVVTLETRPPNLEGKGRIGIRELVINCLRMRPDRIVVGEVRGGEALDMLQAMNTGHDGSLTTGHANGPRDILIRLETMVMMAGVDLPAKAIREQIANAINLIVHQERFRDGTRKITHITEIVGMESDTITLQDLFVYEQKGLDERGRVLGAHRSTGIVPHFMSQLEMSGAHIPVEVFRQSPGRLSAKRLG